MTSDDLGPVLSLERAEVRSGTLVVDAPAKSGLPPVVDATADAAVVRFHGRNDENWDKRGISAAERFDYLYDQAELGEWVPRIRDLAERVEKVHVLMNNCYGDKGVRNAADISRLLAGADPESVASGT